MTALRAHGYKVIEAANGVDALRKADEHNGPIDLLVTDMRMPELGGAALAEKFRDRRPGCPVLHISGYADDQALSGLADADVLEKPFTAATLLLRIRQRLDSASSTRTIEVLARKRGEDRSGF